MTYSEAVSWLRYQEGWTEKEICAVLNGEGTAEIIRLAQAAVDAAD